MTNNEQPVSERIVTEWGVKWSRRNQVGLEMGEDGVLIQEALTMLRSLLVERDEARETAQRYLDCGKSLEGDYREMRKERDKALGELAAARAERDANDAFCVRLADLTANLGRPHCGDVMAWIREMVAERDRLQREAWTIQECAAALPGEKWRTLAERLIAERGEKQPEQPAAAREADGTQFLRENLALLESYVRDGSGSGDGPIALLVMQTTLIELARRSLSSSS